MEQKKKSPPSHLTSSEKAQADRLVRQNVREIAALEKAALEDRGVIDRAVDTISTFCGSLAFVYLHLIWFALWVGVNRSPRQAWHFDPYPFSLLTLVVSLEAILLSTFILITQNRQSRMADRRHHLDLQINMMAEQENTKMLAMLERIETHLGIREKDREVKEYQHPTRPKAVLQEIRQVLEESPPVNQ